MTISLTREMADHMKNMIDATRSSGLFPRNWTMGGPITFAIYDERGEGYIGTVSLVGEKWTAGGKGTINEKAQLMRLCAAANGGMQPSVAILPVRP